MKRQRTILMACGLLAAVLAGPSAATDHTVDQVGLTFEPAELVIMAGDTVNWVWSSGFHTVTNGSDPEADDAGSLFDAPLTSDNPTFSFTFDTEGVYPYFCRPHFSLEMVGTITVEAGTPVESATLGAVKNLFR
jgi:plastocyanin